MKTINTINDIRDAASAVIFKFQTGKISRDDLYQEGVNLTDKFNQLVSRGEGDQSEAENTAGLLGLIKHFSTC